MSDPYEVTLKLQLGEVLRMADALRFWGKFGKTHPDCAPCAHIANQALKELRDQLEKQAPESWAKISSDEWQKYLFDPLDIERPIPGTTIIHHHHHFPERRRPNQPFNKSPPKIVM